MHLSENSLPGYWVNLKPVERDNVRAVAFDANECDDECGDDHEPATNSRWTECAVCGTELEMVPFYVRGEEVAQ